MSLLSHLALNLSSSTSTLSVLSRSAEENGWSFEDWGCLAGAGMRIRQRACVWPGGEGQGLEGAAAQEKGLQAAEGFDAVEWQVCDEEGVTEINQ